MEQEEAQSAIQELNGTELGSRQIEVREDSKTGGGVSNNVGTPSGVAVSAATTANPPPSVAPVSTTS